MNLDVKIDADAVQQAVVTAIMNSTIGAEIEKAIQKALAKNENYWNKETLVEAAVNEVIRQQIYATVREVIKDKFSLIKEQVSLRMTDELLMKMLDKSLVNLEKIINNAE